MFGSPSMRSILVATKNAHKTAEIRAILGDGWQVTDLCSHPGIAAPDETGSSFAENAEIKAVAASLRFDGFVLADDSGLEVDALGGRPGVRSARYAGDGATDAENRALLLAELRKAGAHGAQRRARFRCALVLASRGIARGCFFGAVEGMILDEEQGSGGFGYDALFVPDGFSDSFAELPAETKNQLSHRARALEQALTALSGAAAGPTPRTAPEYRAEPE
jgi:XTP/dITP diphosphohydrolase